MKAFMDKDFLLSNETAKRLYHEYAEDLPIIDYHCHIPPKDIAACRIAVKNRTYTGKSLKPSPQVTDGARELVCEIFGRRIG